MNEPSGRLYQELKQVRPFHSRSTELRLTIMRTADTLRRGVSEVLAPYGVTTQQYNVLRILRGARGEPMATLDIAERLLERTPGVTRLLDRLEAKALVRRERGSDRRQVHCWITASGMQLLGSLDDPVHRFDDLAADLVTADESATVITVLDRIRQELEG